MKTLRKVFIDIGPGALNSEAWAKKWSDFEIIGIEADIDRFINLRNEYPGTLLNYAVWDKDNVVLNGELTSSFGFIANGYNNIEKKVDIKTITIDTIDKLFGSFDEIYIWADIEGSELKMLQGATKSMHKIKWLNLEVRQQTTTESWCKADEIYSFLKQKGFCANKPYPKKGHCDVIFTKERDNYWENRYVSGLDSGRGSYGKSANHKATMINNYIINHDIKSISDFGCGDGNQIGLLKGFENYCGFDISPYIIDVCKQKFIDNSKMTFCTKINDLPESELCLSLDVLYHIIDEKDYENYLFQLFNKSKKYVLIFSTNHQEKTISSYILHRKFTDWVDTHCKDFVLVEELENSLKSSAKFYLYKRKINL